MGSGTSTRYNFHEYEAVIRRLERRRQDSPRRAQKRLRRAKQALEDYLLLGEAETYSGGLFGASWRGEADYPGTGLGVRAAERDAWEALGRYLKAEYEAAKAACEAFESGS